MSKKRDSILLWGYIVVVALCVFLYCPLFVVLVRIFHVDCMMLLAVVLAVVGGIIVSLREDTMGDWKERFGEFLLVSVVFFGLIECLFEIAEWVALWHYQFYQYFVVE